MRGPRCRVAFAAALALCGWLTTEPASAEDPCARVPAALKAAAEIRELESRAPVACEALDRDRFRAVVEKLILEDIDRARLPVEERALKGIGLIPDHYPYAECLVDALISFPAAFYSSKDKRIYLASWMRTPFVILVHEAVHALQDQVVPLSTIATSKYLFSDENLAGAALLEGDAMWVEERFLASFPGVEDELDESQGIALDNLRCTLPKPLDLLLHAPYDLGRNYVDRLRARGGSTLVTSLLYHPPRSSIELLEDEPIRPAVTPFAPLEPRTVFTEQVGALAVRFLLTQELPLREAIRATRGWKSDRFELVRRGGADRVRWTTRWGSPEQARLFHNALAAFWSKRLGSPLSSASPRIEAMPSPGESVVLNLNGTDVEFSRSRALARNDQTGSLNTKR